MGFFVSVTFIYFLSDVLASNLLPSSRVSFFQLTIRLVVTNLSIDERANASKMIKYSLIKLV